MYKTPHLEKDVNFLHLSVCPHFERQRNLQLIFQKKKLI